MAHVYKRGRQYWISYYVSGKLVQKSLRTTSERITRSEKKRLEYELSLGDLQVASKTPLPAILQVFCNELKATHVPSSPTRMIFVGCGCSSDRSVRVSFPVYQERRLGPI